MFFEFDSLTHAASLSVESRSVTAENPTGEKGGGGKTASALGVGQKGAPCLLNIAPQSEVILADIAGPGTIRHIWLTMPDCPDANNHVLRDTELLIFWDGENEPAVKCPVGPLFCLGFGQDYEVHSLPITVNPRRAMNLFLPMPFRRHARVVFRNLCGGAIPRLFYQIDYTIGDSHAAGTMYLHALYQTARGEDAIPGKEVKILPKTAGEGSYIGTFLAVRSYEPYCWCEGEVKFYIDGDEAFPTICGTGTEDYFGGTWAFGVPVNGHAEETVFNGAFMGYPYHRQPNINDTVHERCLYRWHLADPIVFHRDMRVTIQRMGKHGDELFFRRDDVEAVAYWYQRHPLTASAT